MTRPSAGPLGQVAGQVRVKSLQRNNDKKPWKALPPLEGVVESEFVRPVLLGECVLPFHVRRTFDAVLPRDGEGLMDGDSERLDRYPGLAGWWRKAEGVWEANRSSDRLTLLERIDYQHGLEQQFPLQAERIVHNASGMHMAAARVSDPRAVIDCKLYWATAASTAEAQFLCAVLNAAAFTKLARPLMSYGKDERDFHKHHWQLPVPLYDPANDLHRRLATRGAELETAVAALDIDPDRYFTAARRDVRQFIAESEAGRDIEELVVELLG